MSRQSPEESSGGDASNASMSGSQPAAEVNDRSRCFVCSGRGHWARNCISLPANFLTSDAPKCYACGGLGHFARFCPSGCIDGCQCTVNPTLVCFERSYAKERMRSLSDPSSFYYAYEDIPRYYYVDAISPTFVPYFYEPPPEQDAEPIDPQGGKLQPK